MLAMIARLLPVIGLTVSAYATYVHRQMKQTPEYRPWCDINSAVSCSKAIASRYGEILSIANGVYGAVFFLIVFVASAMDFWALVFRLSVPASIVCMYLAYALYFRVKTFCILCNFMYLTVVLLLGCSFILMNQTDHPRY
jgi:vitamin-K-epoxide reductase (warfarin-sensitive)